MTAPVFPAANKDDADFFKQNPGQTGAFSFLLRTLFAGIDQTVENALCRRNRLIVQPGRLQRQFAQTVVGNFVGRFFSVLSSKVPFCSLSLASLSMQARSLVLNGAFLSARM